MKKKCGVLLNTFLCVNCLNVNAKVFTIKRFDFIDQDNKKEKLNVDLNIKIKNEINLYELQDLIYSDNKIIEDLKKIYSDKFNIDVSKFNKDENKYDIFKDFYLIKVAKLDDSDINFQFSKEKDIVLKFKLLPKIDFEIVDEDKIDKKELNYIKDNFNNFFFKDNKKFPLNPKEIAKEENCKIVNLTKFTDIKGNVHYKNEDLINIDCKLDSDCKFKIEIDKNSDNKIYNTNVNISLNGENKDNYSFVGSYNLNEFNGRNFEIPSNNIGNWDRYIINGDVKINSPKDCVNREINIEIIDSNIVRYRIIFEGFGTYIVYSKKLKERDLINFVRNSDKSNDGYRFIITKDDNQVNSEQELEEGEYKLEKGNVEYIIHNSKYNFYKKMTTNELKQTIFKHESFKNNFISKKDGYKVFDPDVLLEPGEYYFGTFSKYGHVLNDFNEIKNVFGEESSNSLHSKNQNKCCCC